MTDSATITQFFIKVDGSDISAETMESLYDAIVEDDLAQPAMFALRFNDPEFTLIDGTQFKLGGEVAIGASDATGQRKPILTGEITSLEPELDQGGTMLVVRGYDRSHRLYRGRKTQTFLKQTDSDIASKVIQAAGLSASVTSTSEQHVYIIQDNKTDMEFLRERAARVGYRITVDNRTVKFAPDQDSPPEAPAQEWGITLISFHARLTGVAQPNSVEVRGWDPTAKQAVVGTATTPAQRHTIGFGKTGGAAAQTAFGSAAKVVITDRPVRTSGEATKLAQAILDDLSGDYLGAEGLCLGEPGIKAGTRVEIKGVGKRFGGKYYVTASRHEYTQEEGYRTTFWVNGRRASSLLATLDGPNSRRVIEGVVIGIVTNVNDPDGLGRIKLKFPWLDDQQESDWARMAFPWAGSGRGLFVLPEVNDEMLVTFEQGDINKPYVIGALWNGKDKPPATVQEGGKVKMRTLKTRAGHILEFQEDESSNKGHILLKTSGGNLVKITDTDKGIDIISQKHSIKLDDQGSAVKITSGGTLEMTGSGNTLKFTQSGLELSNGGGKLNIAPGGIEMSANATMKLKANATLDVEAQAMMNVKSSAILNIQGTLVKIN